MKEEAPSSKKMPRKTRAPQPANSSTPTKLAGASDEILSSLLRLNNFDSNIKDESLDIDLSACVTISGDSAAMLGGNNSLSSTDFWRVLDESAQNAQLELTNASDDIQLHQHLNLNISGLSDDGLEDISLLDIPFNTKASSSVSKSVYKNYITLDDARIVGGVVIKEEKPEPSFSGTFLRPEAPPPTPSPIKRLMIKQQHHEQQHRLAERYSSKAKIKRDLKHDINAICQQTYSSNSSLSVTHLDDAAVDNVQSMARSNTMKPIARIEPTTNSVLSSSSSNSTHHMISSSSFKIFTTLPQELIAPSSSSNKYTNSNISSSSSSNNVVSNTNHSKIITTTTNQAEPATSKDSGATQAETAGTSTSAPVAEPLFKCLTCNGLLLQGQSEYATHEAIGHRIHHRCAQCDRDFEQEASLKKHAKTHRNPADPRKDAWKKCPDCGKCLKLGSMWMHRKIHSDNKKYGCDICGQKFVQKINLTHHSRIHTAEKPYECPECQKRFQERSHLQRHQKYHAQTRSYKCDKCGKMYKTERCLKVHNLVHLEQRPFACTVCEKSFISNSKLKQHSNIHTGERPFKCNYCPRDFTNFPNWLKHTRRRHKVDHKTGEQLENIPSYCSKKSTKTAKAKAEANANANTGTAAKSATANETNKLPPTNQDAKDADGPAAATGTVPKAPAAAKRKKKATPQQTMQLPSSTPPQQLQAQPPPPPPPPPPPLASLSSDKPLPSITVTTMPGIIKTEVTRSNNSSIMTSIPLSMVQHLAPPLLTTVTAKAVNSPPNANKPKRERKQPSPKQLQKSMPPPLLSAIKREFAETEANTLKCHPSASLMADTRYAISNFPDLSITSTEELIMEQALEMEECGLYLGQPSVALDTDNAISSSEATAALHFKIKKEFDPTDLQQTRVKEEYIPGKDIMNQRLLCSSLESSPYSSPASVEMSAPPTIITSSQTGGDSTADKIINLQPATLASSSNSGGFQINSFTTPNNSQCPKIVTSLNIPLSHQTIADLQSILPQVMTTQQTQNATVLPTAATTTQAIINHFYLHPLSAMTMPSLSSSQVSSSSSPSPSRSLSNQKLPSVDTLLFSAAAAAATSKNTTSTTTNTAAADGRFFHVKSITSNVSASQQHATTSLRQHHKLS